MARSRLEIINSALARLGESQVESIDGGIDETSDLAQTVLDVYGPMRDAFLASYPWDATRIFERAETTSRDADGNVVPDLGAVYPYRFSLQYPAIHAVRGVWQAVRGAGGKWTPSETAATFAWTALGSVLQADFQPLFIEYQRPLVEEAQTFLTDEALILKLCAELAVTITYDLPTARYYEERARVAKETAERVEAQGKPAAQIQRFRLLRARYGGGRLGAGLGGSAGSG